MFKASNIEESISLNASELIESELFSVNKSLNIKVLSILKFASSSDLK